MRCAPPAITVVDVVPLAGHTGLYTLLQYSEDSEHERKVYNVYFEMFLTLRWRTTSPHHL
jgi:hypothetical protein